MLENNDRNYTVSTRINRSAPEVFSSVISADSSCAYFINSASGDLVQGKKVAWTWDDYGTNEITVKQVVANKLIMLGLDSKNWDKTRSEAYEVLVIMEFEVLDENSTRLSISESGWRHDEEGYRGSHDNCGGWQHFLLCLKAYLEYGIDLRS